jgi:hypothetical protein
MRDFKTVKGVVDDLEKRFGLKRIVLVGDRVEHTRMALEELEK